MASIRKPYRTLRCCQNCKPLCDEEFKQVVNLKKSGLLIYVHNNDLSKTNLDQRKESVILCNSTNKELNRVDYVAELCQYKTKCIKCRALIQRIRHLIDNVTVISKNEMLGICDYCKRLTASKKCQRCEYFMGKFINNETQKYLESEKSFRDWLCRVRQFLLSLMQGQIMCKHNIYLDSESKTHLDNLLKQINWPSKQRQLKSNFLCDFPHNLRLGNNTFLTNKSNFIEKNDSETLKMAELLDDISASSSTCICKYLLNKYTYEKDKINGDFLSSTLLGTESHKKVNQDDSLKKTIKTSPKSSMVSNNVPLTPNKTTKVKRVTHKASDRVKNDSKKKVEKNKVHEESRQKQLPDTDNDLMTMMINQRKKDLKVEMEKIMRSDKIVECPKIELPIIDALKDNVITSSTNSQSDSFIECKVENSLYDTKMIKSRQIVSYRRYRYTDQNETKLPILFQIQHDFNLPLMNMNKSFTLDDPDVATKIKTKRDIAETNNSGIIRYQLSNREFVDKGWTQLPSIKIMRRYIYNMVPSYCKFDWFKNHKEEKMLFYESTEKLAEIYENGCGKWFYKNGNIALDYYSAGDINSGKRCILYSSGDNKYSQKKNNNNMIASFDYLGNGVVYDNSGEVRLKYNQSEGFVIDRKIGPPGRWMWHTLNEPSVILPTFCDTFVKNKAIYPSDKKQDSEMIEFELEKYRKDKAAKIQQVFKPFEIRIKVVKINEYFSLRIVNQSKIYIQYRCERISLKLNVGMFLKPEDIIDEDFTEISETTTTYGLYNKINNNN